MIEALLWDKTQTDFKLSKYGICYLTYTDVGVKRKKKNADDGIDTALGHDLI